MLKPLRADDTVRTTLEVSAIKRSASSKPDCGVVWITHRTYGQLGNLIFMAVCLYTLRTRG